VSRRGLAINIGLIEGLAVAADWSAKPLTPHEAVKAMRRAHLEPPLSSVLSLQFFGFNASQSYNVAGSFCRFLLDKYGAEALGRLYASGGADSAYPAIFGATFAELERAWSSFVDSDAVTVPDRAWEEMRERLRQPSIFHKTCAHELALRRDAARREAQSGNRSAALAAFTAVCSEEPDDPEALLDVMDAAIAADRPDEAKRAVAKLYAHTKVTPAEKGRAELALGDLAISRGELEQAAAHFARAEALPLDEGSARLATAKRIAAQEPKGRVGDLLRQFLTQPGRDSALDLLHLDELSRLEPSRALFHYLFARQLEAHGERAHAARELDRALAVPSDAPVADRLPDRRFVVEATRLLGRTRFRLGEFSASLAAFTALLSDPTSAVRLDAEDWIDRARRAPALERASAPR
jgi:hypothetical protein